MSIYEGFSRGAMFRLVAIVDDSVNKGEKVPLEIYSAIPTPAKTSIEQFDLYVNWRLKDIEIHEADEWHQVDGKALYYPHRPMADRDLIDI